MKPQNLFSTLICILFLFISCDNERKEQCVQPYEERLLPELSQKNYNSCHDVLWNYTFFIRFGDENYNKRHPNPYLKCEGDKVKVKGFISGEGLNGITFDTIGTIDRWWCFLVDDSITANSQTFIHSSDYIRIGGESTSLLEDIDISQKCYIDAIVTFSGNYNSHNLLNTPPLYHCYATCPSFQVIKIRNE